MKNIHRIIGSRMEDMASIDRYTPDKVMLKFFRASIRHTRNGTYKTCLTDSPFRSLRDIHVFSRPINHEPWPIK